MIKMDFKNVYGWMVLLKKEKGNQYFSETVCSKEKVTTFEFEKT